MKECISCGELKPINAFYKLSSYKDGHKSKCKKCDGQTIKEIGRTLRGRTKLLYKQTIDKCIHTSVVPTFTYPTFLTWLKENDYDSLFVRWRESTFKSELRPSISKIDSEGNYSILSTLRVCTFKETKLQMGLERKTKKIRAGRVQRMVGGSETLDGPIVKTYESLNSATRDQGAFVRTLILTERKSPKGLYFRYLS